MLKPEQSAVRRSRATFWLCFAVLLAAGLCVRAYRSPHFNFDMLYYVANALDEGQPERQLHAEVYQLAAASLPSEAYDALVNAPQIEPTFRRAQRDDPEAFGRTRGLFNQRAAYVGAIRLLHHVGINPFRASVALNATATWILITLMLWWLSPYWPDWALALGLVPMTYALQLMDIARLSTSDMLAASLCFGALYLLFERNRAPLVAFALLALAVLARAEVIILGLMTVIGLGWIGGAKRPSWAILALGSLLMLSAYGWLVLFRPGYGWRMAVSYCLMEHPPVPRLIDFTAGEYLQLLWRQSRVVLGSAEMLLWLIGWGVALIVAWHDTRVRSCRNLLLLIGANLAVRFVLFPALDYRYYLTFVSVTAVSGLHLLGLIRSRDAVDEATVAHPAGLS
ncbi:MAG: hypothetical protein HYV95_12810 [Opitutae bacterium]|nr:hypothetical protein [Opitutae bacterium]